MNGISNNSSKMNRFEEVDNGNINNLENSQLKNAYFREIVSNSDNISQELNDELNSLKDCLFETQVALECFIDSFSASKPNKLLKSRKEFLKFYDKLFGLITRQICVPDHTSHPVSHSKLTKESIETKSCKNNDCDLADDDMSGDSDDSAQCADPGRKPSNCVVLVEDIKHMLKDMDSNTTFDCNCLKIRNKLISNDRKRASAELDAVNHKPSLRTRNKTSKNFNATSSGSDRSSIHDTDTSDREDSGTKSRRSDHKTERSTSSRNKSKSQSGDKLKSVHTSHNDKSKDLVSDKIVEKCEPNAKSGSKQSSAFEDNVDMTPEKKKTPRNKTALQTSSSVDNDHEGSAVEENVDRRGSLSLSDKGDEENNEETVRTSDLNNVMSDFPDVNDSSEVLNTDSKTKSDDETENKSPPNKVTRSRRFKITTDTNKSNKRGAGVETDDESETKKSKPSNKKGNASESSDIDGEEDDDDDDEEEENSDVKEETDSDEVSKNKKRNVGKRSKKRKLKISSTDDDNSNSDNNKKSTSKKRKRIVINSSDEEADDDNDKDGLERNEKENSNESEEDEDNETPGKGRKDIRKILKNKRVSKVTKKAEASEKERRKRIEERQKLYNELIIQDEGQDDVNKCPITRKMVLDADEETKEALVEVSSKIITRLKPHQVEAVKFMWDCLFESVSQHKKTLKDNSASAGCILAHCMGLGKTLSVITLIHTVMHTDVLKMRTCLVLAPLNTVLNWQREFDMWLDRDPEDDDDYDDLNVVNLTDRIPIKERSSVVRHWHDSGGVLIMGYEMFRILATGGGKNVRKKSSKEDLIKCLTEPGPDIVVCDEGHLLKNDNSALAKTVNRIRTRRRIVLTGTPLQNNLNEYYTMVSFVKPNLLGTKKEFSNRFANPILNGQHSNSTPTDVKLMKKRAHVLFKTLDGCVQRRDYSSLIKYLPPKLEFVIMVRLTEIQRTLYTEYLNVRETVTNKESKRSKLFADQQVLYRIWTHPYTLKIHEKIMANKMTFDDSDSFIDDESSSSDDSREKRKRKKIKEKEKSEPEPGVIELSDEDNGVIDFTKQITKDSHNKRKTSHSHRRTTRSDASSSSSQESDDSDSDYSKPKETVKQWSTRSRRLPGEELISLEDVRNEVRNDVHTEWWHKFYQEDFERQIELSGKLTLLMHILRKAADIGDKVLLFSQSLLSLTIIEEFLAELHRRHLEAESQDNGVCNVEANMYRSDLGPNTWVKGLDYERMDGSTAAQSRKAMQDRFNDLSSPRLRLFLISTKAGGLGINMVSANRVVIFDVSWNPSNDMQSIFRCYRFGQTKPVYIYRLAAQGTMEEKIYDRQVIKQSLSHRVIDEQQIERHFTDSDLNELYNFNPDIWDPEKARDDSQKLKLPRDRVLADLIEDCPHLISGYHEHDSLLANLTEEELTEAERLEAWKEYEEEKTYGMTSAQMQVLRERELYLRHMREQAAHMASQRQGFGGSTNSIVQISFGAGEPFNIDLRNSPQVHYEVIMNQLAIQFPELVNNYTELQKRAQMYMPYCHDLQRKWQAHNALRNYNPYMPSTSSLYRRVDDLT